MTKCCCNAESYSPVLSFVEIHLRLDLIEAGVAKHFLVFPHQSVNPANENHSF